MAIKWRIRHRRSIEEWLRKTQGPERSPYEIAQEILSDLQLWSDDGDVRPLEKRYWRTDKREPEKLFLTSGKRVGDI